MENTIVYDKIDEVQSKVEYNGGGIDSLKTDMTTVRSDIAELQAKGVVKSVQRGTYQTGISGDEPYFSANVGISNVNTTKSIVFASGVWKYTNQSNAANVGLNLTYTLNSSSISFYGSSSTSQRSSLHGVKIDWQVVEFY